jgi:hypothetical protein
MIQVKIIRNKAEILERDINEFLQKLGSQPGVMIKSLDIKYIHIPELSMDQAMIIFNAIQVQPPKPPMNPNGTPQVQTKR